MAIINSRTLGSILLLEVDSNPTGIIAARKGSIAVDITSGTIYINQDGNLNWVSQLTGSISDTHHRQL